MEFEFSTDEVLNARFPLHRACRDGDVGALCSLLQTVGTRADLVAEDSCYGWTPIHWAAHFGKLECVMYLVHVGCEVNVATTKFSQTPMHSATFGGHPECVLWLLQAGADINIQDYVGETPIHKAAWAGSIDCVKTLLIQGAKLDLRNTTGLTAADLAYSQGFWECFQLLSNAQNHFVQLSGSLAISSLNGNYGKRQGPLNEAGNRKRLIGDLENICIKKARTDQDDTKGQSNGHRRLTSTPCNGRCDALPQTTGGQDSSEENAQQPHSADMCGSLHQTGSPSVTLSHWPTGSQMPSDMGDLLLYGHFHGFGDTAEDLADTTSGTQHKHQRYSCGPTVYDHSHLGHACSYVRFDIVQRILSKLFGVSIIHAMVITDIDDKIIHRSREENISPTILARMYEEEFKNDMLSLKVLPPAVYLRVTENVPQIVGFIERIISNGHAYITKKGDVYFDILSIDQRYGKFNAAVNLHSETDSYKRDTRDFALWKSSKPQEPSWESPWGQGRPGWHIECSTIASSVFGSSLDIHSGGIDLAFPHHENEIAQSEAYHQCEQWGNYFLHAGHLHIKGSAEKMSKSLKNYITIKDFLQSYSANEFRMFCLLTKYRSAIDYSDSSMSEARSCLATIITFDNGAQAYMRGQLLCQAVQEEVLWEKLAETKELVVKALADDFDTPQAVSAIMDLVYQGNRQLKPVTEANVAPRSPAVFGAILSYLREVLGLLGIDVVDRKESVVPGSSRTLHSVVEQLSLFRSKVRTFALAPQKTTSSPESSAPAKPQMYPDRIPLLKECDSLRKDLAPLGVLIKDRGTTSTWEISQTPLTVSEKDQVGSK